MPNTNVEDEELENKIYSLLVDYDRGGMWQGAATKEIMELITARERKAVELESLETGKYVASQIINGVSAQDLYSAFCKSIDELTSTKDKS